MAMAEPWTVPTAPMVFRVVLLPKVVKKFCSLESAEADGIRMSSGDFLRTPKL